MWELRSETLPVDKFLKEGKFDIPKYQRSYAWDSQQIQDFWEDLYYLPKNREHFFGNVVIKRKASFKIDIKEIRVFEVIDGQQRLTTSLIFLSQIRALNGQFKEFLDKEQLISLNGDKFRLELQDQDKKFFKESIIEEKVYPRTNTISQKRLQEAKEFFKSKLQSLPPNKSRELLDKFLNKFKINFISIDDDREVASMFETINDRGKGVSDIDKTKSFLMHMSYLIGKDRDLIPDIYERFGVLYKNMFAIHDPEDRSEDLSENSFQSYHWGIFDGYSSKEYRSPFLTIKNRLRESYREEKWSQIEDFIEKYVEDIEKTSYAFNDILRYQHSSDKIKELLGKIFLLRRTATFFPLIMASWLKFKNSPDKLLKILKLVEVASFRMYAIRGKRSDAGLSRFVILAHDLHYRRKSYDDLIKELKGWIDYYADDKSFRKALKDDKLYWSAASRDIKYLLYEYNKYLCENSGEDVKIELKQILSKRFEVEHILASGLDEVNIPENLKHNFDDYVNRLGNLTLISSHWNPSFGKRPFQEKKSCNKGEDKCYEKSVLKVQQELSGYEDFTKDELQSREEYIIKFALNRWRIGDL